MLRLWLHFRDLGSTDTQEAKAKVIGTQTTAGKAALSGHSEEDHQTWGVGARAHGRNSSRNGVLSLEMRTLRGHLRVEERSQRGVQLLPVAAKHPVGTSARSCKRPLKGEELSKHQSSQGGWAVLCGGFPGPQSCLGRQGEAASQEFCRRTPISGVGWMAP